MTSEIGPTMAEAARTMHVDMSADELLQLIVDLAAASVPGFERASASVVEPGNREDTKAATDDLARDLDLLQYTLGEGPCVEAMRSPGVVEVPHLRHEQRWPKYVAEAAKRGVTAQLSIMLYLDDDAQTLGGLNMYSLSAEGVSQEARAMAELFATQAAVALGSNRRRLSLDEGMLSRQMIGQAVGIVTERFQIDEHAAFRYLARLSSRSNTKLRVVAEEIVEEANGKYGR